MLWKWLLRTAKFLQCVQMYFRPFKNDITRKQLITPSVGWSCVFFRQHHTYYDLSVPAWYGLYSSWLAPIVYCVMGGSKDISDGPTAILSHMVLLFTKNPPDCVAAGEFRNGNSPPEAILLAFFVGIILFGVLEITIQKGSCCTQSRLNLQWLGSSMPIIL